MAKPRASMTFQEMQFAELVAGGAKPADAYRQVGYTCKTYAVARTGAAKVMQRAVVRAYLENRVRETLAMRDINMAGIIIDLHGIATNSEIDLDRRVGVYELLAKLLTKFMPPPPAPLVLPETVCEMDAAVRAIAIHDAVSNGQITIERGMQQMGMLSTATDIVHGVTIAREIRSQIDVTPPPGKQLTVVDGAAGNVVRPKWLKPPAGGGPAGTNGNGSDPAA